MAGGRRTTAFHFTAPLCVMLVGVTVAGVWTKPFLSRGLCPTFVAQGVPRRSFPIYFPKDVFIIAASGKPVWVPARLDFTVFLNLPRLS
uniref:Secreted protein n=1 Tax=Steinernema glaseri TaxID=37863 RepID=A0A1I8AT83_9BILA